MVSDYGTVLDQPSAWIDELVDFLGSVGVHLDSSGRQAAIASLDAGLRHQRTPQERTSRMWDTQFEVLETLKKLDGPHLPWVAPDLGPEPDWVDEVFALRLDVDILKRVEETLQSARAFRITQLVWKLKHRGKTTDFERIVEIRRVGARNRRDVRRVMR
jgi:hypothetical protein